ncbi:hypothetical protein KM1_298920, partial [Entamoeba histolytica HM-3:IMSS]
MSTHPLKPEIR